MTQEARGKQSRPMDFNIEQINEEIKRDPLVRSAEAFDFFDRERRGRVGAAELTNLIRCCGQRPLDVQVNLALYFCTLFLQISVITG